MAGPKPDTRPTVDFGTRYGRSKSEAASAARTVREGQARAATEERAESYRRAMKKRKPAGRRAEMFRKQNNPNTSGSYTPSGRQFEKVEY